MSFTTRPVVMGTNGMVTSSHYLATEIGHHALKRGGNVVDAAVSMWFAMTLTKPDLVGAAGEVPILLYLSDEETVLAINGSGPAPKAASIAWFRENGYELIPEDGFTPAVVPGAFDAWLMALDLYGTFSLADCLKPSIDIASDGYPIQPTMVRSITASQERFAREWPTTAAVYLPGGKPPVVGQVVKNPDWARTFKEVAELERTERRSGRTAGITACRDHFYRGPMAEKMVDFMGSYHCHDVYGKENTGLMTLEDLEKYEACIDKPITSNYRGLDVYKCGPWTQGPAQLELYNLLEGFDLRAMGHNSVDYLHTWTEAAKLAFADREHYYGDPDFADVPLDMLLSKSYADERRELIDPKEASMLLRPGRAEPVELVATTIKGGFEGDTVHCEAVDPMGNMISATPSGGWIRTSPLVPGLGFPMGTRGQQFNLTEGHPNCLMPEKKPRITLTPSLVMKDGEPYMVYGTPGGDGQDQWTSQFFLNYVDFDMDVQLALDKPSIHTNHFTGSFWPKMVRPGELRAEPSVPEDVLAGLSERGHKVVVDRPWSHGRCLAIRYDPHTGVKYGGASPRTGDGYAIGW
ncbi:TPA: gamma-glutamyltransferase family protein [Candidatus Bathyarchaeota archaeon]|nr:gamma-glutamyltransferase family protein [Candidatus Bathyarchaeota archaeon]